MRRARESGQATVDLLAVLPFVALLGLLVWQAAVAGQAMWLAGAAARAAARAQAVGADPLPAARATLPPRLETGLRLSPRGDDRVRVSVRIPSVLTGGALATTTAEAGFARQAP